MRTEQEMAAQAQWQNAGEIYSLIPLVMQDIGSVGKERRNSQQNYAFRGIEDMYLAAHPAMVKHGIFCAPKVLNREVYRFEKTNDQGKVTTWIHVAVEVEHRFFAGDGSYVSVTTWGEGLDNSDKATNKAMSGAMKYALIELFCVPTADVEDADRTSPEMGTRRAPVATTTQPITFKKPESAASAIPQGAGVNEGPSASAAVPSHAGLAAAENELHRVFNEAIKAKPLPEVTDDCITAGQAANLAKEFRKALPEKMQKDADDLLHEFLRVQGIKDVMGKPSKLAIKKESFLDVRQAACEFAGTFHV